MNETFLIIDGSSLIHRAFFALPSFTNKKGVNTGAVYGLCNMLLKLLEEVKPSYMAVAFDKSRHSFRTEKFADYKGQRKATPPELKEQFPLAIELLTSMGIPTLEMDNYEADDLIGTLSATAPKEMKVIIVTGDRDEFQLIKENVHVYFTKKGITQIGNYDEAAFQKEYEGLSPRQIIDLKGLMGDTSDNIPGVPGVGPKTALKLIKEYQSVEAVLDHAEEVKGKSLKEKLITFMNQALLSKELATICLTVPMDTDPASYRLTGLTEKSRVLMDDLQFKNMWNRFSPVLGLADGVSKAQDGGEMSMFGEVIAEDAYETVPLASLEAATAFLTCVKEGSAPLSLMYETEGLLPHLTLTSLSGAHDHKVYVWDKALLNDANMLALLCDGAIKKIVPNPKELYKFMQGKGVSLQGVIGDPSLAAYLYEPGETHYDVKSLAETYLPASCGGTAQDVEALMPVLEGLMAERGLTELYRDIELPLTKVLANMEVNGITLDKGMLDEVTKSMTKQVADLEQKAKEEAGEDFNVNSPKQLGVILFEKLGLPIIKKTKSGYSTDVSVLEQLQGEHPIIETIMEYRTLSKLLSTYLVALHPLINPNTGRIHTHFNQMATVTGRLSSTDPNLQNIPTRTEVGKQMRRMFVPGKGYDLLMSCDYSQVELRVMASIALEYMERMGIRDTQFFIARHFDKEHPHVHIAFNRIDNSGNTISDRNERLRSTRICKELTQKYGLHMANGKDNVKRERLKEPDRTKYELYDILKKEVGRCGNWNVLIANLKRQGVEVHFKHKGQTDEIQGVVFTKNGYHFNGSKVDRRFSYSKIDAALDRNRRTERIGMPLPSRHEELPTFQPESRGNDYLYSGSIGLFMPDNTDRQTEENYFEEQLKRRNKKKKQRKIRF